MDISSHAYSLTFARISLGVIVTVHGIANSFGVWGGPGVEQVANDVANQLASDPATLVTAVAYVQLLLGLLLVFGPLARIAAMAVLALLVLHILGSARWQAFFVRDNGIEFLLACAALCVVVAAHGPGAFCARIRLRSKGKKKE